MHAPQAPYGALFEGVSVPAAVAVDSIGECLRCAFGLSAWKSYRGTRWALRVNPSSGNLHPTEVYVVWQGATFHYAADGHALERRCAFDSRAAAAEVLGPGGFLVGLTSVHWREAWKYGERAFRYCQHDLGHALAALRFSAARLGWSAALVPECSDAQLSALLGLDRHGDFEGAEVEAPGCLVRVTAGPMPAMDHEAVVALVAQARDGVWQGAANRLSPSHVDWSIIERVSDATRYPGAPVALSPSTERVSRAPQAAGAGAHRPAREILLQRRSAVAFDPRPTLPLETLLGMLARLQPGAPPWDAIDWTPHVHLVLFVHRVDGLVPGVYVSLRDPSVLPELRAAMRPEFLWEPVHGLFLLVPTDVTWVANRLSCDQDIASDGFFSLGMLARFDEPLQVRGDWFYRRLFWECGMIGQVLYLEAEAAGVRGTGIGCFYDDPVHEALGLSGHAWQSLYHFSMGVPIEDARLTTQPGYDWE